MNDKDASREEAGQGSHCRGYKSILGHPWFREMVKGCTVQPLQDQSKKYSFPVSSVFTLGRLEFNDIFIDDQSVSRNHAKVEVREHGVVLIDSNSKNGTFVNGTRIGEKALKSGDMFSISPNNNFLITVESDSGSCLTSLKKNADYCFIDLKKDTSRLFDFFCREFGQKVVLEVERQTCLFLDEFEKLFKNSGRSIEPACIVSFLNFLSQDAGKGREGVADSFLSEINNLASTKNGGYEVVFFETRGGDEDVAGNNGIIINSQYAPPLLISGIKYESFLYLFFASDGLGRLEYGA